MCLFCAAIPTTLALGAAAHGQQREAERRAQAEGRPAPGKPPMPAARLAAAAAVVLVVAAVISHTQQPA